MVRPVVLRAARFARETVSHFLATVDWMGSSEKRERDGRGRGGEEEGEGDGGDGGGEVHRHPLLFLLPSQAHLPQQGILVSFFFALSYPNHIPVSFSISASRRFFFDTTNRWAPPSPTPCGSTPCPMAAASSRFSLSLSLVPLFFLSSCSLENIGLLKPESIIFDVFFSFPI